MGAENVVSSEVNRVTDNWSKSLWINIESEVDAKFNITSVQQSIRVGETGRDIINMYVK